MEVLEAEDAEDRQRRVAGALLARGCRAGDRVAFSLPSSAGSDLRRPWRRPGRGDPGAPQRHVDGVRAGSPGGRRRAVPRRSWAGGRWPRLVEGPPAELAPLPVDPAHALHLGHHGAAEGCDHGGVGRAHGASRLRGRGGGLALRPRDRHMVCSPMYHTVSVRFAPGRCSRAGPGHPQPFRGCDGTGCVAPPPPDDRLLGPDPSPADIAGARARARGEVRVATPFGARRRPLPALGEAGHHGAGAVRAASGSSTGRPRPSSPCAGPTNGWSIPARWGGPGPAGACPSAPPMTLPPPSGTPGDAPGGRRARHHLVRPARFRPFRYWGERGRPPVRPGAARPAPWATWAISMPRDISISRGGGTT